MLDHALAAAARGWKIFPVISGGKRPLIKKWEAYATDDAEQIKAWWETWPDANYGIACGPSGLFVVDADVKDNGLDTLTDLELEGLLPPTYEVVTPSGGRHLYYSARSGGTTARRLGPGVDTRGQGGYVVGAGSSIEGVRYTVDEGCGEIQSADGALLRRCESTIERSTGQGAEIDLDQPGNIRRAIDFLKRAEPAVLGSGSNAYTYRTACVVRDFGISEDLCADLMDEHFSPRCTPPWPKDKMAETVIAHAYTYAKRDPGEARTTSPETVSAMQQLAREFIKAAKDAPPDPRKPAGRFKVLGWQDILDLPDPSWLVHDTITEHGLTLIYGPTGSYKSFLALDLALHVAQGASWCARPTIPGRVIYCAGEGASGIKKRITAWSDAHQADAIDTFGMVATMPIFGDDDQLREFAVECLTWKPGLIVFDTVAHAMAGMDENTQKDSGLFVARCAELARTLDCAVILVHHTGKDANKGARGSTVLPAACDTILEVSKPRPLEMLVSMPKQKDAEAWTKPIGLAARQVGSSLVFFEADVTPRTEEMVGAAYADAARNLLDDWPTDLLPVPTLALARAIADELGTDNTSAIRDYLKRTGSKQADLMPYVAQRSASGQASHWTRPKNP